jgi:hypothetical protein
MRDGAVAVETDRQPCDRSPIIARRSNTVGEEGRPLDFLQTFPRELAISIANGEVWLSILLALAVGAGCWAFGTWVARAVGLLPPEAPAGETLGVGLASGLIVVASWWAAIWSGGRSSFTPVAVGFAVAIALALARRARAARRITPETAVADLGAPRPPSRRSLAVTAAGGAAFVVIVGLLYGSTLTLSPRNGTQPLERIDTTFYSVLGRDLATTGTESSIPPSGFSELPGESAQTWYHWGELWLASIPIAIVETDALAARYFVVLPLLLLAAAALTGTFVRRASGGRSRGAFAFGFVACPFLAPLPLIPGPFFSAWAVGLAGGIPVFGLAAVAGLLALYCLVAWDHSGATGELAWFVGSVFASILPTHIVIALLGLFGAAAVAAFDAVRSLGSRRGLPHPTPAWRRTLVATAILLGSTVVWGAITDHGLGGGAPLGDVTPFNASWRETIVVVTLQAGILLAPPFAWLVLRQDAPRFAAICLGTTALVVAGALAWGWRLASFNMFYFFFGGIAVFATPVAAAAVWMLVERMRASGHARPAIALIVLCSLQLELGAVFTLARVQGGSPDSEPVPISVLQSISRLPADAKLAYACQPFEEISFVNSSLLGIDAHTGRRVVPMCFEADTVGPLFGAGRTAQQMDAGFASAPQRALYPSATASPSPAEVAAFLKAHGIGNIYVDAVHPNTLVPDAVLVASDGDFEVLRVP